MKPPVGNRDEPRADGGRTDQRGERAYYIFSRSPLKGAHQSSSPARSKTAWRRWSARSCCSSRRRIRRKEISLYINSPGGVVTSGMAIYDTMQFIKPAVSTLLRRAGGFHGLAASVARAKRACVSPPRTRGSWFTSPPAVSRVRLPTSSVTPRTSIKLKRRLNEVYVQHTGQDYDTIEKTLDPRPFHDLGRGA